MTAELAVGLPAVALLLLALLAVVAVGVAQSRCVDAARAGARSAALGEDDAVVVAVARRLAGERADVRTERDGEWVTVTVATPAVVAPWGAEPVRVRAGSLARAEP